MRKLVYATSLSLDGYIDAEVGDPSWVVPDEELHRHFNDIEREIDTLLYGRRMYELMAGYWPTADRSFGAWLHRRVRPDLEANPQSRLLVNTRKRRLEFAASKRRCGHRSR